MKLKLTMIGTLAAVGCICLFCVTAEPQKRSPRIEWMNDAVYYETNTMVWDTERNAAYQSTNDSPYVALMFYKTVVYTNKISPIYFRFGDRPVELGARADGVIVWRNQE